jgi:hypothetical protein
MRLPGVPNASPSPYSRLNRRIETTCPMLLYACLCVTSDAGTQQHAQCTGKTCPDCHICWPV